jgi:hypothetical protein
MAHALSADERHRAKLRYAKAAGVAVPSNVAYADGLPKDQRDAWTSGSPLRKPTRTLSGVAGVGGQ